MTSPNIHRGTKEDTLQQSDFWWMTHGPDQAVCYRQEKNIYLHWKRTC